MTEKICDVKSCGELSMSFSELVKVEKTRFLIVFPSTYWDTKLNVQFCKKHFDQLWDLMLDFLKGK